MKAAQIAQFGFVVLAATAVYLFVATAKDSQARRACIPLCTMQPHYAARNRTAPDFELKDLEGRTFRLSSFRGKTVLLNFWTTTCQPCLEEMPSLAEFAKIVSNRKDIVVLSIATDAERGPIETALQTVLHERRPPFPVLLDPELSVVSDRFGTHLFPETWIIDRDGVIRARFDGARDFSDPLVIDLLDSFHLSPACEAEFLEGKPSGRATGICQEASG